MLYVVDNYDSFVYNLVHYIAQLGIESDVVRNDELSADELIARQPSALVISPGPCTPNEAGISLDLIRKAPADLPILGVCLGHQALAQSYGAKIIAAKEIRHGKVSAVAHEGRGLFAGLKTPIHVTRYHSLAIDHSTLSADFVVDAKTEDHEIMAIRHRRKNQFGVQFHPESIASEFGHQLLYNFLKLTDLSDMLITQEEMVQFA